MSQRLHYNDHHEQLVLYQKHKAADRDLKLANNDQESVFNKNDALIKSGELLAESDHAEALVAIEGVKNAQNAYDANLWRAQQHKNEHLDKYIESARQDAEAQGIPINLGQPKE